MRPSRSSLAVSQVLIETLAQMKPDYPERPDLQGVTRTSE